MGYHQAGFTEIVGVDIVPQPHYPFKFVQADATTYPVEGFDFIHASPPCQAHTALKTAWNAKQHVDLIPATRELLQKSSTPYVIENVVGAPLLNPIRLCGTMFGLGVKKYERELRRHRLFECSFSIEAPKCSHGKATIGIYGDHARDRRRKPGVRDRGIDFPDCEKLALGQEALGMPWVQRWKGLSQAIPPAYTKFIGSYWLANHAVRTV